jgi:surfeit locus 1 family protein
MYVFSIIERRTAALNAPPVDLDTYLASHPQGAVAASTSSVPASQLASSAKGSTDPTDGSMVDSEDECKRLKVRGKLLHDHTLLLGPRTPPSGDGSSTAGQGSGYFLITPLQLHDGRMILVNRGWCPLKECTGGSMGHYEIPTDKGSDTEVEVLGVIRKGESQPSFLTNYDPISQGSFIWLDLPLMAYLSGVTSIPPSSSAGSNAPAALLIDALQIDGNGPAKRVMRRRTIGDYIVFTTTPFVHSVYAATWFTLSIALVALTYVRFGRKTALKPTLKAAQRKAAAGTGKST